MKLITVVTVVFVLVAGVIWLITAVVKKSKKKALLKKYKDLEIVEKIMKGYFWIGQTAEQLRESLGKPDAIDKKVLKTKIKEVWKYSIIKNRYNLRITIEDGYVVSWNQKI